jgi:hypothetical protein
MGDKNFKQIGKFQFSVEVPVDSDLALAIRLATERRDKKLEDFVEFIKLGANRDDKDKILENLDGILKMNESIKLMEDAAIAVRMYKLEEQKNKSVE